MELELAGNAFFDFGEGVRASHVLQLIWRISTRWTPGRMTFAKRCRLRSLRQHLFKQNAEAVISSVKEYIRRSHAARPMFKGGSQDLAPSDSCWLSYFVSNLCAWYPHLSFDAAMDTPYRVIWQLWNRQLEKMDPDYTQRAPAVLEGRRKYLEELNERLKAEFEAKQKGANGKRS